MFAWYAHALCPSCLWKLTQVGCFAMHHNLALQCSCLRVQMFPSRDGLLRLAIGKESDDLGNLLFYAVGPA